MKNKMLILLLILSAVFITGTLYFFFSIRFDRKDLLLPDNTAFFDRDGRLLRFIPDAKGERHIWISGKEIPDIVKNAFIAAEDQRFYEHPGFDAGAIVRALKDNLQNHRIVSGASTITQQTVRLVYPRKRTYKDKFTEIVRSVRMEISLSKKEILEQYLNRVPMGNNITGIELAARTYYGKSCRNLTIAEAALIASLPKAPGVLNPYGENRERLFARKDWVLAKMQESGYLSPHLVNTVKEEKLVIQQPSFPNGAPHLVDLLISRGGDKSGMHRTTIDREIQTRVEQILKSHEARLSYRGANQAAAMVAHNSTMEVLASVGSLSYQAKSSGFNNGTIALRSAGSTLKPFVYAQALEDGYPVTWLLADMLRAYKTPEGDYLPANFDRKEYGPVTMRTALGNSLNISAIKMLEAVGQEKYYEILKRIGFISDTSKSGEHYGLGLVIGNPEISLEQLVTGYAMLANGGVERPLKYFISEMEDEKSERIFSPQTAYIISDILSDPTARLITFGNVDSMRYPFKISIKTGTSTKYRDGWAIAYTPEYTAAVWVGNFEGNSTFNISGAEGAAPILKEIMGFLYKDKRPAIMTMPEGIVSVRACGISGMKPGRYCKYVTSELFIKGTEPQDECSFHTKNERQHELPMTYASWVYNKKRKGVAGNYRLKGLSERVDESSLPKYLSGSEGIAKAKNGHFSIKGGYEEDPRKIIARDNLVKITYPLQNDRFVLENGNQNQIIKLEAVSDSPVKYVEWFVDGRLYAKVGPPYLAYWKPEKGRHSITVSTSNNIGDSVRIRVE